MTVEITVTYHVFCLGESAPLDELLAALRPELRHLQYQLRDEAFVDEPLIGNDLIYDGQDIYTEQTPLVLVTTRQNGGTNNS